MSTAVASIVVCTYNRAQMLAQVLGDLVNQRGTGVSHEIIVVDNNSQDETRRVADAFAVSHGVRYCFEPRQGLSHARNAGLRAATGKYVGYVDDDCRVPPQWLRAARDAIDAVGPDVLGGPYFALYTTPRPRWYRHAYGSFHLGREARVLGPREYLHGGNLFVRRGALELLGGFDTGLGMQGRRIWYGEETALQDAIRARLPNAMAYYEPALFVYHRVAPHKMDLQWAVRERFASGRSSYQLLRRSNQPRKAHRWGLGGAMLGTVLMLGADLARGLGYHDSAGQACFKSYVFERVLPRVATLGFLWEESRDRG